MRTQIAFLCIVAACLTVNSPILATDRQVPIIAADTNYKCPVSWWKFNEGIGTTAYDSVGGNPGTIHGATWTTDYTGIALDFDGDDYVEVSDDSSLRFTQYDSFSICSWAKPFGGFIVCKMRASAQEGYFGYNIGHTASNRYFFTAEKSMRGSVSVYTGEIPQGDWSHVTAVYDNKGMKIFLDGELEDTGTFTYDTGSTAPDKDLAIGARSVDSLIDRHFTGIIDDVRIYNRALSVEEVRQVYWNSCPNCPPVIWISDTDFIFLAYEGEPNPESQILRIGMMGMGTLNWEVTADCNWINAEPNSGSSIGEPNEVTLSVDISGLNFGIYDCNVTITDPNAVNSPQTVHVKLGFFQQYVLLDFGDCPDPNYPTLMVHDGARHIIDPNVFLGSGIDSESDGQPTLWADGDDVNGIPDEDGVSFTSVLFDDCIRDVNVVASCEGKLDAWLDFNADGDWSDPGEQIFASEPLNTGSNILTFSIPSNAAAADTYARFRFSTTGGLEPYGPALDGEVEDYMISIETECGWIPGWLICLGGLRPWGDREYEDWVQWNKPECWCHPRQCYGDINGASFFGKPVTLSDLAVFKAAFNKTDEQLRLVPHGICADLDHQSFFGLGKRVTLQDLHAFKQYFNLPDSQVPADCWCDPWW